jgi:hypothetical protein
MLEKFMNEEQLEKVNRAVDKMLEENDSPKLLSVSLLKEPITLTEGDTLQIIWSIKTSK